MKVVFNRNGAATSPALTPPEDICQDFHRACQDGNMAAIDESLRLYPLLIDAADDCGWTPLHHAAMWAQTETVDLLLRRGARTDIADNTGLRADEQASRMSYEPIAALIRAVANRREDDAAHQATQTRQSLFKDGLQADICVRAAPLRLKK